MTDQTRDSLLIAIASGLEDLLAHSKDEYARDDQHELLKLVFQARKEAEQEEQL